MKQLSEINLSPQRRGKKLDIRPDRFELSISMSPYRDSPNDMGGVMVQFFMGEDINNVIKKLRDMADVLEKQEKEQ